MTQFNSNQLNASDELIISKYLTKYASDNSTVFTLTNKVVVDSYLNEAKKLLNNCKCTECKCTTNADECKCTDCKCDIIVDFIDLLENIEERKTKPTPEISEEA
jgi:hypothetical protein